MHTFSYHYLSKQHRSILMKRRSGNFFSDFNRSMPFYNWSYQYRRGLGNDRDAGLTLSFFNLALDLKQRLWQSHGFGIAASTQVHGNLLAQDSTMLLVTPVVHVSYDARSNLALYANPFASFTVFEEKTPSHVGVTTGLVYGKSQGIGLEYAYVQRRQPQESRLAYEQIRLSYTQGLDALERSSTSSTSIPVALELGAYPVPSLGLALDQCQYGICSQLFSNLGQSPQAMKRFDQSSHWIWQVGGRLPIEVKAQLLSFGLVRNQHRFNALVDGRWNQAMTENYSLELGWGSQFSNCLIYWLRYDMPLLFLPNKLQYVDVKREQTRKKMAETLTPYQKKPQWHFLHVQVTF